MSKKNIVILGAGLAGLRAAQDLTGYFKKFPALAKNYEIILVDKNPLHVFKADLYEVVAAFHKKITEKSFVRLKETVATPIAELIDEKIVKFINDEVVDIDLKNNLIKLKKSRELKFDCLSICLGASPSYFGIAGLEDFSFSMQSVHGSVKLSSQLDEFFCTLSQKKANRPVHITVGGGGATGVEVVGELAFGLRKLAKKYKYPIEKIHLQLVEGFVSLAGLSKKGTEAILKRFRSLGVKVYLNSLIQKVERDFFIVKMKAGKKKKIKSDIFIWTGGVMVNSVVAKIANRRHGFALPVNPFLQVKNCRNVFAAGDNAFFFDPRNPKNRVPMLGQHAFREGIVIAENIFNLITQNPLKSFVPNGSIMLLPLGGKFAVVSFGNKIFSGFLPWALKRLVSLKYMMSIMPFFKALKKWWCSNEVFMQND